MVFRSENRRIIHNFPDLWYELCKTEVETFLPVSFTNLKQAFKIVLSNCERGNPHRVFRSNLHVKPPVRFPSFFFFLPLFFNHSLNQNPNQCKVTSNTGGRKENYTEKKKKNRIYILRFCFTEYILTTCTHVYRKTSWTWPPQHPVTPYKKNKDKNSLNRSALLRGRPVSSPSRQERSLFIVADSLNRVQSTAASSSSSSSPSSSQLCVRIWHRRGEKCVAFKHCFVRILLANVFHEC